MDPALRFKIPPRTLSLLKSIGRLADERGESAYAVGGIVRDLFLKRPGVDIDITVEGDGVTFAEKFAKLTGSEVETFTRFGTSIVVVPGFGKIDIATARMESYEKPGALPAVKKSGIMQDLYRRDFSLNAMALSLSPGYFLKLLDPFGGLEDLKKGRIRALHEKSFIDDPTRIFRAIRFEQRFRERIEPRTQKLLSQAVRGNYIQRVSGERLRNELRLIFQEPHPKDAVRRLGELKILPYIHAALGVSFRVKKSLSQIASAIAFFKKTGMVLDEETMVWFQALLMEPSAAEAASLSKRLMLSKAEQKIVSQSARVFPNFLKNLGKIGLPVSRFYRFLSPLRPEVQCFLMAMAGRTVRKKMVHYFERIQETEFWIRGRDLKTLGIEPGFQYSFILLEALNGQLDGKFKSRKEALAWVKKTFVL
jgi:tRNA nucleotidyltransferase (CCA-adding enzyme)